MSGHRGERTPISRDLRSAFDPERTFDRLDNRKSVYAPVEHSQVWTNAPTGVHCNDCWRRSLAGENVASHARGFDVVELGCCLDQHRVRHLHGSPRRSSYARLRYGAAPSLASIEGV
jgi:hypothetical protein